MRSATGSRIGSLSVACAAARPLLAGWACFLSARPLLGSSTRARERPPREAKLPVVQGRYVGVYLPHKSSSCRHQGLDSEARGGAAPSARAWARAARSFILTAIRSRRSRRRSSSSLLMSSSITRGVVSVATSSLTRARSRSSRAAATSPLAALRRSASSIASSLSPAPVRAWRRRVEVRNAGVPSSRGCHPYQKVSRGSCRDRRLDICAPKMGRPRPR